MCPQQCVLRLLGPVGLGALFVVRWANHEDPCKRRGGRPMLQ